MRIERSRRLFHSLAAISVIFVFPVDSSLQIDLLAQHFWEMNTKLLCTHTA